MLLFVFSNFPISSFKRFSSGLIFLRRVLCYYISDWTGTSSGWDSIMPDPTIIQRSSWRMRSRRYPVLVGSCPWPGSSIWRGVGLRIRTFLTPCWTTFTQSSNKLNNLFSSIDQECFRDEDPKQLILFPEGTNLNSKTRARSDAFAKKNNRHVYHNVLHPRTTGFVHVTKGMAERGMLDAVYDVTLAYPDNKPETEMSLLKGQMPSKVFLAGNWKVCNSTIIICR